MIDKMDEDPPVRVRPPYYLFSANAACWQCGERQQVVTLVCSQVEEEMYDGAAVLKYVEWLPEALVKEIQAKQPRFERHRTKTSQLRYYGNTCACGAVMGDHFLHQPDEAFFPMTDEALAAVSVTVLAFADSFATKAAPSWGVAERRLDERPANE